MTHCDTARAIQLLNGLLAENEQRDYENHLSDCQRCRERLEQETGDRSDWDSARVLLSASSEIAHWSSATKRLDELQAVVGQAEFSRIPTGNDRALDLSMLAPTDDPKSLGRMGSYEVLGVIGRGAMGIVFKALDGTLNRTIALKVLDPSLAGHGAARQRFAREARAMAAISHEHVVPIYAVDEHRGLPYFAMEYVAGGTLEARLRHQGSLELISVIRIAHQIALALAAAHDSGMVHRDIKPGNILLDRGTERVRVTDFGLARVANETSQTRSGLIVGTPQFMAPEQVRGEACDPQADLFSLGSVLYAMCTGHSPFRAETIYGAMQRIVHDTPRPIRDENNLVPQWLEAFTFKLLEKDPRQRFSSAKAVAGFLELELAHFQNPHATPQPARPWSNGTFQNWKTKLTSRFGGRVGIGLIACSVMVAFLMQPWTLLGQRGGNWNQTPRQGNPQQPSATVPLWHADGTLEALRQVDQLRSSLQRSQDPTTDSWEQDIQRLNASIRRYSNESP